LSVRKLYAENVENTLITHSLCII